MVTRVNKFFSGIGYACKQNQRVLYPFRSEKGVSMQSGKSGTNRLTRADVAKLAGVSEATVSYVLNGTKHVSPEVEKRVLNAAKALNYTPNRIAQSLAGNRTNSIAVVTDDITNLYQMEIIKGMQAEALNHEFIVFLFDASDGMSQYMNHIVARGVEGVFVIAGSQAVPDRFLEAMRDAGVRVLADFARRTRVEGVSYIKPDLNGGFEQIVGYLSDMGHRAVGYVGVSEEAGADGNAAAFRRAAAKILRDFDPPVAVGGVSCSTMSERGEKLMQTLLKSCPDLTAVVCSNDAMAVGVTEALRAAGRSVPGDVSVIGVDNIQQSTSLDPNLTTLSLGGRDYGRKIFEVLFGDIVKGRSGDHIIPVSLIVRRSAAPPKKAGKKSASLKEGLPLSVCEANGSAR